MLCLSDPGASRPDEQLEQLLLTLGHTSLLRPGFASLRPHCVLVECLRVVDIEHSLFRQYEHTLPALIILVDLNRQVILVLLRLSLLLRRRNEHILSLWLLVREDTFSP